MLAIDLPRVSSPLLAPARLRVRGAGRTHAGCRRRQNQDGYLAAPELGLFAVADGIGGAPAGDVASSIVLAAVHAMFVAPEDTPFGNQDAHRLLSSGLEQANRIMLNRGREDARFRGMGTTFAGIAVGGRHVTIAHVGDSRVYRLRDGELTPLTEDHSAVAWLLRGGYPREHIKALELDGVITQAVGTRDPLDIELRHEIIRAGDVFLLSTDGLHEVVDADDMREVLMTCQEPVVAAETLIEKANLLGGPDNVTAVVIHTAL